MKDTRSIKLDLSAIPNHVRDDLAAATLNSVKDFLRQQGGRERLDERIAANKQAAALAAKNSKEEHL